MLFPDSCSYNLYLEASKTFDFWGYYTDTSSARREYCESLE